MGGMIDGRRASAHGKDEARGSMTPDTARRAATMTTVGSAPAWRSARRAAALGVFAAILLMSAGCSAIFDFETQCESDSDCAGDRCVAGECIAGTLPCAVHTDCDQRPGVEGAVNGTELCIAGQCQALLFSHESGGGCTEMFGRASDDPANTVVIPTLQSLTGEGAAFGAATAVNGYRMATKFANESGALGQRSIVMVLCDDASDVVAAEDVATTIIERAGATSMLGPAGDTSQDVIVDVLIPKQIMSFAATTSLLYSTLVDDDLAFRVYPSDQLSLDGLEALTRRYPGSSIGLLYRSDAVVRRVLGETVRQAIVTEELSAASYVGLDPASIAAAVKQVVDDNDGEAVDLLFVIGLAETGDVVTAYREALPTGFSEKVPRIVTDAPGALIIPTVVAENPEITPRGIEAIVGAAISTQDFASLYQAIFETNDNLQLTGVFYDAAMLTILAHVAEPQASTGLELAAALRSRLTDPDGQVIEGSQGIRAFGNGVVALANGENIQYVQVAGGQPTRFDSNGDVRYPIIAGTFLDPEATFFVPLRALFNGVWLDTCSEPGGPCDAGWTSAPDDPGQACVDVGLGFLNICAPVCDLDAGVMCPTPEMTCAPQQDESALCFIQ